MHRFSAIAIRSIKFLSGTPCKPASFFNLEFFLQTDHTEELEELCQAANHLNESGGESSGGEFWLKPASPLSLPEAEVANNSNAAKEESKIAKTRKAKKSDEDFSVTDLVVI